MKFRGVLCVLLPQLKCTNVVASPREPRRLRSLTAVGTSSKCGLNETKHQVKAMGRNLPIHLNASAYCDSSGMLFEPTMDVPSGQYGGWIDRDDWIAWDVFIPAAGLYNVAYRVASLDGSGGLQLETYGGTPVLAKLSTIPATGAWQNWETLSHNVLLQKGYQAIAVKAMDAGWNLEWVQIDKVAVPAPTAPVIPAPAPTRAPTPLPTHRHTAMPTFRKTASPTTPITITAPLSPLSPTTASPTVVEPPQVGTTEAGSITGFIRAEGTSIVDGDGKNFILRGMGLGGWMIQEPYMMLFGDSVQSGQHEMFADIEAVIGAENLQTYHKAWLDNYCTIDDINDLADSGFNSIRVPIHYNLFTLPIEKEPVRGKDTWLSDGFDRLDKLLEWCKSAGIYMILDLHAAPGGQGRNANINDYDSTKPSMWEDSENVRKAIALWVKLAKKYKNEPYIAGYDLLNEPNWNFVPGHPNGCTDTENAPLKSYYDSTIAAIRQVDTNHLIFIEGNCWGNNHDGLWPIADTNVALSLHRYWIDNTVDSIQKFLDYRDQYNVPLWMGESGENNNWWYSQAVILLESNNIGWAWWTWKKMQSDSGSYTIVPPDDYYALVNYWSWGGDKPSADVAFTVMMEVAEKVKLENCIRNDASIKALFQAHGCQDADYITLPTFGATKIEAESFCEASGVNTEDCTDVGGGQDIGWFDPNDYLAYNINVQTAGPYTVLYRISSMDGTGGLQLESNSTIFGEISKFPVTGAWQNWTTITQKVQMVEGPQTIAIRATASGWNLNWLEIIKS